MEYAVVDIETTGGNASGSRITEIAVIIYNGNEIVHRWETLINPEKEIPLPIFALTGISNEMVKSAPLFKEVAPIILQLLEGRIFVAHNVNFDYSFIKHELEKSGISWSATKLCTVRASRKIKPGLPSYSLGSLCRFFDIPVQNFHRAGDDALAATTLLKLLLSLDEKEVIKSMIKKTSGEQQLPPNLSVDEYKNLPEAPGVYYFYNSLGKVIYIGKAINIKKRVGSHFSGHKITPQRQHFLRDVCKISFEVCATELMALLLECFEIKRLWPIYNTALKRYEPKFGLYSYEARNGYKYLAVGKTTLSSCIEIFNSEYEGVKTLLKLANDFKVDYRFCKFGKTTDEHPQMPTLAESLPDINEHNDKIRLIIDYVLNNKPSFIISDKGRVTGEYSCILVEEGHFFGMGYLETHIGLTNLSTLKEYMTPYKSNGYIMQLLYSYAQKNPNKIQVIDKFKTISV